MNIKLLSFFPSINSEHCHFFSYNLCCCASYINRARPECAAIIDLQICYKSPWPALLKGLGTQYPTPIVETRTILGKDCSVVHIQMIECCKLSYNVVIVTRHLNASLLKQILYYYLNAVEDSVETKSTSMAKVAVFLPNHLYSRECKEYFCNAIL